MLKPAEDRLNYADLLTPPPGYEVSFAVGTTYSLDLEAMLGVPLALSLSEEIDGTLQEDPVYVLEAIRRSSDKFVIFCEAAQIKVPGNLNKVFSMIEDSVCEIALKNGKSFHPKVWLIHYHNEETGDDLYRLLVLSRNLTFDRSWDIAVALEGKRNGRRTKKNQPLVDFLNFLMNYAEDKERKKYIQDMISELPFVHFDAMDKHIQDFDFIPLGIAGYDKEQTELFETYHDLIVMSPFITGKVVEELDKQSLTGADKVLITRKSELHKLPEHILSTMSIYTLKDAVIDGESAISGENTDHDSIQTQDIHAKLYARTKYNNHQFYIGSANCSTNAFEGNIEFLLKLDYKKYGFKISHILEDLFGDENSPFERIEVIPTAEETEKDIKDELQKGIKALSRVNSGALVTKEDDDTYSLDITFDDIPTEIELMISPLFSSQNQPLQKNTYFQHLRLLELGCFYKIIAMKKGEKLERVIKIDTQGIPEERINEVFRSLVKDSQTFLKYVAFLLSDDFLLAALEDSEVKRGKMGTWDFNADDLPPLYENMLKAAARTPEKLEDIETIIKIIDDEKIIPEEFYKMYQTFREATKKVRK